MSFSSTAITTGAETGAPRTLSEAVYRKLRNDILWGKFPPGAALKSDQLRDIYSVGISPLREALSRLASERLVTASGQRGFRVAPLTADDVRDTMETRIVIEREALTRSIALGDIAWETNIVACYHALSRLSVPEGPGTLAEAWSQRHRDFHMALISACGSRWQMELAALLFDQAERHRVVTFRIVTTGRIRRDSSGEHEQLMQATLARDAASATKFLDYHYRTTAQILMSAMERSTSKTKPDGVRLAGVTSRKSRSAKVMNGKPNKKAASRSLRKA